MSILSVQNLSFDKYLKYYLIGKIRENIHIFNYNFEFGKIYCINSNLGDGGWGISWAISGQFKLTKGQIKLDNKILSFKELQKLSWGVGLDGEAFSFFENKTTRNLINKGLTRNDNFTTVEQIAKNFMLTNERLDNNFKFLSGERWRASIAIGFANKKKIYCFPWIKPEILIMYKDLWFKNILEYLKKENYLIIIPTINRDIIKDMFDEAINL